MTTNKVESVIIQIPKEQMDIILRVAGNNYMVFLERAIAKSVLESGSFEEQIAVLQGQREGLVSRINEFDERIRAVQAEVAVRESKRDERRRKLEAELY